MRKCIKFASYRAARRNWTEMETKSSKLMLRIVSCRGLLFPKRIRALWERRRKNRAKASPITFWSQKLKEVSIVLGSSWRNPKKSTLEQSFHLKVKYIIFIMLFFFLWRLIISWCWFLLIINLWFLWAVILRSLLNFLYWSSFFYLILFLF